MELRPGYKQTEAGVILEDWDVKQLGEVIEKIVGGGTPSRSIQHYWGGEIPWVTVKDFATFNPRHSQEAITRTGLQNSASHLIPKGTLITSTRMALGKAAVYEVDVAINQDLKALFLKPVLKTQFLHYWFQYHEKIIDDMGSGSTVKGISLPDLKKIEFLLPTRPEQEAIAEALSDADALIESLEQLIIKKRHIKQGAMQQLLSGKKRLPGFSGEWQVKRLGDVVEIVSGGTPKTGVSAYWDGDIKWCTPTDITGTAGKYLSETARTISGVGLANCSARLLPAGALLLCSRATIGEIKIATGAICTNQGFKSLICGKDVSNEYLYYLLLTMKARIVEKAIGSTFLEISKKDAFLLEVSLPPIDEQTAIAQILTDMDAEIAAIEARRDKTRAIKQGMMQALLTGRTRLI
ncbi:Type I restriction modification DNA specificity domain protein [Candidatus Methylobacter favarea]|uniref:Type I restriction modification DNA specificity domain protein n=1 Tax=Candidatus Methylobacter favarea TaxID=2707345 RepID=A0A8S0Y6R7_9GAMM|nr:restriction endonuclease subunit S [Candidatus Methylobacter favarea]CAA9891999.1 Type I restriction modification DNA specificity domain protein [Candidatus Methylobacter favarea]